MPVDDDAQPFHADGGPAGVLLLHGFTGTPASMVPWGRALAAEGFTVDVPRLPGHGTTWQELNRTRWEDWYGEARRSLGGLRSRSEQVFVCGLSMGGCLALLLAAEQPEQVAGLALVNPSVTSTDRRLTAVPLLKHFVPAIKGIGGDIKRPGVEESGYDHTPLRALDSLRGMWRHVRDELPKVVAPILLFRSRTDHVVDPSSAELIRQRVSSREFTEQPLEDSYHVATLDYDAPRIFAESAAFFRKLAVPDSGSPG
ncbi:MAG TPA: alpha/beta fold hydrolase [Nocardioidaceae bacterium]|nr:alpha/beta fold hydrolase [Nocardioidaceae bacterium]